VDDFAEDIIGHVGGIEAACNEDDLRGFEVLKLRDFSIDLDVIEF